jgi:hypothetical protein
MYYRKKYLNCMYLVYLIIYTFNNIAIFFLLPVLFKNEIVKIIVVKGFFPICIRNLFFFLHCVGQL